MKLSKKDLNYALWYTGDFEENELYASAATALEADTLEIEGYVREDHIADDSKKVEEWIRFDPNDPKTFPPELGDYLVRLLCGETGIENWCGENFGFTYANESHITHWRPLPKPPQEQEADKQ